MADDRTAVQKRAERNSATKGEDGHAPVLAERAADADEPDRLAKKNQATPALKAEDNYAITDGEGLSRKELDERAKKNSASFPQPDSKPVLVHKPDDDEDDDLTPKEHAARQAKKAVQSSPDNKSMATRHELKDK